MSDPLLSKPEPRLSKESKKRKVDHEPETDTAIAGHKKQKKSKKRPDPDNEHAVPATIDPVELGAPHESKKRKVHQDPEAEPAQGSIENAKANKTKKRAKSAVDRVKDDETESAALAQQTTPAKAANPGPPQKKTRFIAFIGNLPYTTTTESLAKHFAAIHPDSIRHRMEQPGKEAINGKGKSKGKAGVPRSRGFAFLEFSGYDRMKSCLKSYHHSMFDDGKSPARRINVELTAGGGGSKSQDRRERIKAKNWKLNEQRKRRMQEEAKQRSKGGEKQGFGGEGLAASKPNTDDTRGDIHPSRMGRVKA